MSLIFLFWFEWIFIFCPISTILDLSQWVFFFLLCSSCIALSLQGFNLLYWMITLLPYLCFQCLVPFLAAVHLKKPWIISTYVSISFFWLSPYCTSWWSLNKNTVMLYHSVIYSNILLLRHCIMNLYHTSLFTPFYDWLRLLWLSSIFRFWTQDHDLNPRPWFHDMIPCYHVPRVNPSTIAYFLSSSVLVTTLSLYFCWWCLVPFFDCRKFWENMNWLHVCINNFFIYTLFYFIMNPQYKCSHAISQCIIL